MSSGVTELPISATSDEILSLLKSTPMLIISGETGSGKSTLVPKLLYEEGYSKNGLIGITQPRRVAAISLAKHVSNLMGDRLGGIVGYSVRFSSQVSRMTKIKYMTDGMLLREAMDDNKLTHYSVIIIDEVHERSARTDILLGLCQFLAKRNDLKILLMSATLDVPGLTAFFPFAKSLVVAGRKEEINYFCLQDPFPDYIEAAMITILQLNFNTNKGDILVFLPGKEEIEALHGLLVLKGAIVKREIDSRQRAPKETQIAPGSSIVGDVVIARIGLHKYNLSLWQQLQIMHLYAALSLEQQHKVLEPTPEGHRKVILATNIAETSITIPGIKYVVDTGLVKRKTYDLETRVQTLVVAHTSQAESDQRAGRAGRQGPGECYRLFTSEEYERREKYKSPEIQCDDLAHVYLELKELGIHSPLDFPFLDPPSKSLLTAAALQLHQIGAVTNTGQLTDLGHMMAKMPVHPLYAKALLLAPEYNCIAEVTSIIAMMSSDLPLYQSEQRSAKGARARRSTFHPDGDHLTLLNLYSLYEGAADKTKLCEQFGLNEAALLRVKEIRRQLAELLGSKQYAIYKAGKLDPEDLHKVRHCLCQAHWMNVATLSKDGKYYTSEHIVSNLYLHPTCVFFGAEKPPEYIVFTESVYTSRFYIQHVSKVSPEWITTGTV